MDKPAEAVSKLRVGGTIDAFVAKVTGDIGGKGEVGRESKNERPLCVRLGDPFTPPVGVRRSATAAAIRADGDGVLLSVDGGGITGENGMRL
jgi:hypothetical protein